MRNYEVIFIIDPVLSGDEVKATAQKYITYIESVGSTIVHIDEMGLRPLAYTINKKSSGIYYCIEFQAANGAEIAKMELALKRDETILRFLTVALDKFGIQFNIDKRAGKIGKKNRAQLEASIAQAKEEGSDPEFEAAGN